MTRQLSAADVYSNFIKACKSDATKIAYAKGLKYFMGYMGVPTGDYNRLLEHPQQTIEEKIKDFILYLQKDHPSATVSMYVAGIRKFYDMNRAVLSWKWIRSFEGEKEKYAEDKPYTHDEIRMLVDRATLRNKAIILTMCSSGVRVGALPQIRLRDLESIDPYNIYKITVYPKSKKARYFTFCTPECRAAIDSYLEWRKRFGEKLHDDSPLFRRSFNVEGANVKMAHAISRTVIIKAIAQLLKHCGIRPHLHTEGRHLRHDIMQSHGMRKFFETQAYRAGMDVQYIRRLLGQKGGSNTLEDSYLKLEEQELLEGDSVHRGYIGIFDNLTIDPTHRLQKEIQTLRVEKSEMDLLTQKMAEYDKILGLS